MKRIVALMTAATIMVIGAYPAHAQVIAISEVQQLADSAWIKKENGKQVFYFAMAYRGGDVWAWEGVEPALYPDGIGVVGKGKCHTTGHFTICSATGRGYELAPGDLEFDPLLSSARMTIDARSTHHEVPWTGEGGVFYPEYGVGGGLGYAGAGAAVGRYASIEGTLFDRPFKRTRPIFSMLAEGANFFGAASIEGRRYVMNSDGTVTLTYRFASH
jgi:hypothetical protein